MHSKKLLISAAISLTLTGSAITACSTPAPQIISVPVELQRPARPVLPRITVEESTAVPWATWIKITQRDRLRRQYAEQLEIIIDSTRSAEHDPR